MRASIFTGIACAALICTPALAGNYILTIDGKQHEVDIGKQTTVRLPDGKNIRVKLEKKAVVSFQSDHFSFDHPSNVAPSRTDLGDGIFQTMMNTPLGTLVIVQEYTTMDPSGLVDTMLNELTKEEKQYGYQIDISPAKMKLANGTMVTGKKAVAEYRGEGSTRHVLSYSNRDAGIMIITMVDKEATAGDRAMIETFWKTLKISMR